MKFKHSYLLLLILTILFLSACGKIIPPKPPLPAHLKSITDLELFPQNLMTYTNNIDMTKRIISKAEQLKQDEKFNKVFFSPWDITYSSYKESEIAPFLDYKLTGLKENQKRWTIAELQLLRENVQEDTYPSMFKPAISLNHIYLRALPTASPYYTKSTPNQLLYPFDEFQYTSLPIGTPLFVSHLSKDKRWYFVQSGIVAGWVKVRNIGFVDAKFRASYKNGKYAALIKDKVKLPNSVSTNKKADIGTMLPIKSISSNKIEVMLPVRKDTGKIEIAYAFVPTTDIVVKPIPLSPMLIAQIGNEMIGQLYGWAGLDGNRDCSSTMRDLFTPFGLWLPRNSTGQAKTWDLYNVEKLSLQNKTKAIKAKAIPFASLIWLQGHIGLYLGTYKGEVAYFHNIWGIKLKNSEQTLDRHILGRCVITSLEAGDELEKATDNTLLKRMKGISTIPGAKL